jgi:hypothetical protein
MKQIYKIGTIVEIGNKFNSLSHWIESLMPFNCFAVGLVD